MKSRKRSYYHIVFILLFGTGFNIGWVRAQNPEFSQYYASTVYLNPAFASNEDHTTLSTVYRNQWRNIAEPYQTTQMAFLTPFYLKGAMAPPWGGAGFSLLKDWGGPGDVNTLGINGNFAYNLRLNKEFTQTVSVGAALGILQKSVGSGSGWGSQYDNTTGGFNSSNPSGENNVLASKLMPDVALGAVWFGQFKLSEKKKLFTQAGLGGYHLNRPNESLVEGQVRPLPSIYKLFARIDFPVSEGILLSPNFVLFYQNNVQQVNPGSSLTFQEISKEKSALGRVDFTIGGWYRLQDAIILSAGINATHYTIIFSYDANASSLKENAQPTNAMEVSFAYRFYKVREMKGHFDTPRF